MKILLFNPPRYNGIPVIREDRCEITERYSVLPPYSLLQIGALLKDRHDIQLIDANGFDISYDDIDFSGYDVMIFRFTPTTFDHDMESVKHFKEINPKGISIGICLTLKSLAKEVLDDSDMDIFLTADYENVIQELLGNLKNLQKVNGIAYRQNNKIILNQNPQNSDIEIFPAYELLPSLKPYFINTPAGKPFSIIYTSKGCPYNCMYCTVARTRLKLRSADSIYKELRYLKERYNIKTVSFFDETFTINRERVIELCKKIKPLKINWYCNTRSDLVDAKLLNTMNDAGCSGLSFGIESGSQTILDNVKKGVTVKQQEDAIRLAKKAGIKVYTSFVIGLPGENNKTIKETIEFVRKTLPTSAQFNVAVPYPGTALYAYAKKNNLLRKFDWKSLYQHSSIMKTEELSTKELENARKDAYRALYFNPRWILQNVLYVLKNPSDFTLASRYLIKIMKNFFIHKMRDAH